ncbi:MAG: hypothetical protein KDD99_08070 [Bacteroidetes bacterium]|nr:hypothetical protein [Bacteroidota bacterium]
MKISPFGRDALLAKQNIATLARGLLPQFGGISTSEAQGEIFIDKPNQAFNHKFVSQVCI